MYLIEHDVQGVGGDETEIGSLPSQGPEPSPISAASSLHRPTCWSAAYGAKETEMRISG